MISYLISHYGISIFLLVPVLFLLKSEMLPNKLRLFILYAVLIKSMLPWGYFSFPLSFMQEDFTGMDYFQDQIVGAAAANSSYVSNAFPYENIIVALYILSSFIFLLLYLKSLYLLGVKVKRSVLCDDSDINNLADKLFCGKYRRSINIVISDEIKSPFVWWGKSWVIVLSRSVLALTEADKEAILAHEFAHIKRKDFIKYFILMLAKSFFIFSPFVFILINRIIEHEETEADLLAMELSGISPNKFGKTILKLLNISGKSEYQVPALGIRKKRRLTMRLKRLFQRKVNLKNRLAGLCIIVFTFAVLPFSFTSMAGTLGDSGGGDFINPVKNGRLTQAFGHKKHPITKKDYFHQGIDLAAKTGTAVVAAADGKVATVDYNDKQGYYVVLSHADGYSSVYAHLDKVLVAENDNVTGGENIAELGNTGVSTGPHVHFEIRKDGKALDPAKLISNK